MSTKRFKCIVVTLLLLAGCGISGYSMTSYRSAILSGRALIKPALEIETQFPKTEHMIIMFGATGSDEHEWQTVSFFGGRYELTMTVNVILSSDGTKILKVVGEPTFYLSVCQKILDDGGGATYIGSRYQKFGLQKWNEFRDSEFDLKTLDPAHDGSTLPNFDAFADIVQQSRKVWR
jgi:hypothetical protein